MAFCGRMVFGPFFRTAASRVAWNPHEHSSRQSRVPLGCRLPIQCRLHWWQPGECLGSLRGADTRVCRVETRLDAFGNPSKYRSLGLTRTSQLKASRHECRDGTHECARHKTSNVSDIGLPICPTAAGAPETPSAPVPNPHGWNPSARARCAAQCRAPGRCPRQPLSL